MVLAFALGLAGAGRAWAAPATIYVDNGLPTDCAGTYNTSSRSCGPGTAVAYRTLASAAATAQPGDTVLLRGGTYQEPLIPPRSGSPGQPITFKAFPSETATLANVSVPAIQLRNVSYLVVNGLTVTDVTGWGRIEDSAHNTISNSGFSRATATGTTGGLKFVRSSYNKVLNNTFEDGTDNLVLQESDRNLVLGNTFTKGRHSLLSIRCGNFNVIRNNRFANLDQKAAEIYDCEGVSDAPYRLDATKRNVFEDNTFSFTRASDQPHRYNGIQYAGQNGIVRRNVFFDNQGGALNFQVYPDEALYNNGHRVYHNTFYNNRCYGISASSDVASSRYFDNRVRNNILYLNVSCAGGSSQTGVGNATAVILQDNAIVTTSPLFVAETGGDFHLNPGSPMIDAAAFLTRAVGAGSGTHITVQDVGYFFDGYGIPGEVGDLVQLEGQTDSARIVGIDYATRTLTLSEPLTWSDGHNLHLRYAGSRPDVGAFEFGLASGTGPAAPSNLRVTP